VAESALGLIETRGLVGVIEAADTAAKAADVQLLGIEQVGGGLVSLRFSGDVAAVKAAIQAASRAVEQVATLVSAHVIARPHAGVGALVERGPQRSGAQRQRPATGTRSAADVELPALGEADLDRLSVTQLRQLARRVPGLALQGRQISRANKQQLIQALQQVRGATGDTP